MVGVDVGDADGGGKVGCAAVRRVEMRRERGVSIFESCMVLVR